MYTGLLLKLLSESMSPEFSYAFAEAIESGSVFSVIVPNMVPATPASAVLYKPPFASAAPLIFEE